MKISETSYTPRSQLFVEQRATRSWISDITGMACSWTTVCNNLFGEPSFGSVYLLSRPVVLGLCHSVSLVDILVPSLAGVSSALNVELGVVKELSCLGNILLVVFCLLLLVRRTNCLILCLGQSSRNIRVVSKFGGSNLFFVSSTVVILVSLGSKQIHFGDGPEKRLLCRSLLILFLSSIQGGGNTSSIGGRCKCRCRSDAGKSNNSGSLHLFGTYLVAFISKWQGTWCLFVCEGD
mmetsp:Transcript_9016/g.17002  ORF Transcript_9016/g.17002 Transcript_9016/m.17002 type:complete len:236 (+) Transcript_9016:1646-2353(+)